MPQPDRMPDRKIEQLSMLERADVRSVEILRPVLQSSWAHRIGKLGQLGNEPPLLMLSAGLLAGATLMGRPVWRRAAIRMMLAHLVTIAVKEWGKNHVDRSRPDAQLKEGYYHMSLGHSREAELRSFPSGHTAGAVAVALAFKRDVKAHGRVVMSAAALIGALQVMRRAHYPGDVLAGALVGMAAEKIASFIIDGAAGKLVAPAGLEPDWKLC